jgi:hypothetical protein
MAPNFPTSGSRIPLRSLGLCAAYRVAQGFDLPSAQIGATFEQLDAKKIGTTRYAVTAVIRHNIIVSPPIIRRNAYAGYFVWFPVIAQRVRAPPTGMFVGGSGGQPGCEGRKNL